MRDDTTAPKGYTPAERAEIEAAVRAAGLPTRMLFSMSVLADWSLPIVESATASYDASASREQETREALERLFELLDPLSQDELAGEHDVRCALYSAIRPALAAIEQHTARKEASFRETAELLRDGSKSASKPYQRALQRDLAHLWALLGGTVDGAKPYRRFFEAAAKPIYVSGFGRERGLSWTENTFSDHVRAYRDGRL